MSINPKTTAAPRGSPAPPMIIPFPVAGIVMALVAAAAGFSDFFSEPRIRRLNDAWYHMVGNLAAVVLALINFFLRYAQGAEVAIKPWGVVLSLVVVGMARATAAPPKARAAEAGSVQLVSRAGLPTAVQPA